MGNQWPTAGKQRVARADRDAVDVLYRDVRLQACDPQPELLVVNRSTLNVAGRGKYQGCVVQNEAGRVAVFGRARDEADALPGIGFTRDSKFPQPEGQLRMSQP